MTCKSTKQGLLVFIKGKQNAFAREQAKLVEKSDRDGGLDEKDTMRDAELTAMRAVCDDIEIEVKHMKCK